MQAKIFSPAGYGEVTPLDKTKHRDAHPREVSPAFAATLNAVPVTLTEFPRASFTYPLVFTSRDENVFNAVVVTGMKKGENLFINGDGKWRSGSYIPAFVRSYPLCLAEVREPDGKPRKDRLVCIAKNGVVEKGIELFDDKGEPTDFWKERQKLLQEMENDRVRTDDFCKVLKAHGLFKPFGIQAKTGAGEKFNLRGMYRIDEAALTALPAYEMRQLIKRGWLEKIYAHIISLQHFQDLLGKQASALH